MNNKFPELERLFLKLKLQNKHKCSSCGNKITVFRNDLILIAIVQFLMKIISSIKIGSCSLKKLN